MPFFADDHRAASRRRDRKLGRISAQLLDVKERKKRIIEVYASGDLSKDAYIAKNRAYEAEATELSRQRAALIQSTPLLDQQDAVEACISQFCDDARARLNRGRDFASKRQFLLDHVEKVTFIDDKVTVHGSVPLTATSRVPTETAAGKLEFRISDQITSEEKLAACRRTRIQRARKSSAPIGTSLSDDIHIRTSVGLLDPDWNSFPKFVHAKNDAASSKRGVMPSV